MVTLARWLAADWLNSANQRVSVRSSLYLRVGRRGAVGDGLAWREWP
jgi:hypothetical protein